MFEDLGLQWHSDANKPDVADQLLELLQICETIRYSRSSSRSMTPELVDDLLVDLGRGPPLVLARTPDALEAHVVQCRGSRVGDGVSEEVDGLVDAGRHVSVTVMYSMLNDVQGVDGLVDLARCVLVGNACKDMSAYSY